jgi:arsenate reductase
LRALIGYQAASQFQRRAMILFGISTCDTCKKAIKALEAAGRDVTFRDIRANPLSEAEIDTIVTEFGDLAVNKQSTTYRAFNDFLKASEPEAQIAAQPAVMKRPVIEHEGKFYLGWDEKVQSALL